jgi:hypothetical protein
MKILALYIFLLHARSKFLRLLADWHSLGLFRDVPTTLLVAERAAVL